jgi:hypothetical protein
MVVPDAGRRGPRAARRRRARTRYRPATTSISRFLVAAVGAGEDSRMRDLEPPDESGPPAGPSSD